MLGISFADAAAALGLADHADRGDLTTQLGDARADPAPVGLDLRLTGTAQTHTAVAATGTTTGLPRQRLAPAAQARHQVLQLGQLDLRLALLGPRVLREDVQDERGAVDDLDLELLLQLTQLTRRQLTVADHRVRAGRLHHVAQLGDLAGADVRRRVRLVTTLHDAFEHLGTRGLGEAGEFGHRGVGVRGRALGPHPDEHDPLEAQLPVLDLGDVLELGGQPGDTA